MENTMISNLRSGMGLMAILTFVIMGAFGGTVSVSPVSAAAGTQLTASGTGLGSSETAQLYFDNVKVLSVTAADDGAFTFAFTIPQDTKAGNHTVKVVGESSGVVQSAIFTVQTSWPSFKNVAARTG